MEAPPRIDLNFLPRPLQIPWTHPDSLARQANGEPFKTTAILSTVEISSSVPDSMSPELDDETYMLDVLNMEKGQTEQSVDDGYAREALELGISLSPDATLAMLPSQTSIRTSVTTATTGHERSDSTSSQSTGITSTTSGDDISQTQPRPLTRRKTLKRTISFTQYDKFLDDTRIQEISTSQVGEYPPIPASKSAPSIFSVSSKKSFLSLKKGFRRLPRFRKAHSEAEQVYSCVCCCNESTSAKNYQTLPCSHTYCRTCLRTIVFQAMDDESRMPSKCCSTPIPGSFIKNVLSREEQARFIKIVLQYSTPWKDRIFCPNARCGEFISGATKIDPKFPFQVVCRKCKTRICKTCKRVAHPIDQDCPADWELEAVLSLGENKGWKRCYKCRTLVELTHGCTHMTCRCKAQFCYNCGAIWSPVLGCPNFCNGDDAVERRRAEEEQRQEREEEETAEREAAELAKASEILEAARRSAQNEELDSLRKRHVTERDAFLAFEQKQRWAMWTRHGSEKKSLSDNYAKADKEMKERHIKTTATLEDRQVAAELELRQTLKQERKACLIRLRHMEAYCDGLTHKGPSSSGRLITEKHLSELNQQYSARDHMDRLQESRINIMREKQARQLETLMHRQKDELRKLKTKYEQDAEEQEQRFVREETMFEEVFVGRKDRLMRRWMLGEEILRKRLEDKFKKSFGLLPTLAWPSEEEETAALPTEVKVEHWEPSRHEADITREIEVALD